MKDGAGEIDPWFWRVDFWLSGLVRMSLATHLYSIWLNRISSFRFQSSVLPTRHLQYYSPGIRTEVRKVTRSHAGRVSHKSLSSSQFSWTRLSNQLLNIIEKNKPKTEVEAGKRGWVVRPAHSRGGFPSASKFPGGQGCLLKCRFLVHTGKKTQNLWREAEESACKQTSKTVGGVHPQAKACDPRPTFLSQGPFLLFILAFSLQ